ncbi:MAG: hypothetical protein M3Y37_09615 [Chloroflexota bacterium]|nr:hypothetical protein [Chloroflexota bacterium]
MLFSSPTTPVELTVVGEHADDPDQLLLLGEDGNYYAFSMATDHLQQIELTERWEVQPAIADEVFDQLV